jgi:hypothetical protein
MNFYSSYTVCLKLQLFFWWCYMMLLCCTAPRQVTLASQIFSFNAKYQVALRRAKRQTVIVGVLLWPSWRVEQGRRASDASACCHWWRTPSRSPHTSPSSSSLPLAQKDIVSSSVPDLWHFVLVLIRILGSVPLTNRSGSCFLRQWPSRCKRKFFLLISFWRYIFIILHR